MLNGFNLPSRQLKKFPIMPTSIDILSLTRMYFKPTKYHEHSESHKLESSTKSVSRWKQFVSFLRKLAWSILRFSLYSLYTGELCHCLLVSMFSLFICLLSLLCATNQPYLCSRVDSKKGNRYLQSKHCMVTLEENNRSKTQHTKIIYETKIQSPTQ